MKKIGLLLGLALIAVPVIALACHALLTMNTPSCETVASSYEFQGDGGSRWFRGVASGDLASFTTDATRSGAAQTGTIFNGTKPAGTYSETFKMQVANNVHTDEVGHCNAPKWYGNVVYKHDGNSANCSLKDGWRWLHPVYGWDETIQGAWVVDTPASDKPGTFSDYPGASQTKSVTIVACYVECSETVDQGWAYNGDAFDVGSPAWGPWTSNGDGTFSRTGTQATARHQYRYLVDKYDDQKICKSEFRDEPGSRPVEETMKGYTDFAGGTDCKGAWARLETYDPDGVMIDAKDAQYTWVLPYGLEETTLFGVLIKEPAECDQPEPSDGYSAANDCTGVVVTKNFYLDGKLDRSEIVETFLWADPYTPETFQSAFFKDPFVEPKTCEKTHCEPMNLGTWYECNTGNSTYTATSADKCWCGGLTGRRHYHTSYDCGQSYVEEGNWLDAPKNLGYYSAPVCAIGGWCAK